MERMELNGDWQFRAVAGKKNGGARKSGLLEWMPASVPGTVHTDLMAAGQIPDPFYRMNEVEVQWVDAERWVYRRTFRVEESLLAHEAIDLVAEGLDTFATLKLNGKALGTSSDMFVEHRFDAKKFLRPGDNTLEIEFDSPTIRSQQLENRYGKLNVSHEPPRVYARKAQYSFGWDWGPKLTTSGIWRPIYLEAYSHVRIKNIFARATTISVKKASVRIDIALERRSRAPVVLRVEMKGKDFQVSKLLTTKGAESTVVLSIPNPHLWWPNGYGEQHLYEVSVTAEVEGLVCETKSCSFGVRSVRLVQEQDGEGRSFIVEINGKRIYCKGADWIPSDSFAPRIPPSTYERLLTMARDAHMTMVRVWGGGYYEDDVFYELCDRLGLMVWQDFMFACGEYPDDAWFRNLVRDEAEKAVIRLRNHPSVVLWCGNNECEWIFCRENPGKGPDDMSGAAIFRELLPSVCRTNDGSRPYWRSSPFGVGYPNDESNGNHHEWDVWGIWKDYRDYEKVNARFVTEFGFQAPAALKTMEGVTLPQDRSPQSRVLEHHNKLPEGTERLYRFQASHYPMPTDYEDFIYKGQLTQAEALKTATEHWRRRKFGTAGSMFWQLNDCWPVSSWSVIDSALRPKAAYYFAKKFYAPVLVSFKQMQDCVEVWVTNDTLDPVRGELSVVLRGFDGQEWWTESKRANIPANGSTSVLRIAVGRLATVDRTQAYLHAWLRTASEILSENRCFLSEPKHMNWQPESLSVELSASGHHTIVATLSSKALAKNVYLEVVGEDVRIDDNFVDVDPRSKKEVRIFTKTPVEEVRKKLKIRTLWG